MAVKCILFDADGVVINSDLFSEIYQKQYAVTAAEMLPFFKGEFQDCMVGKSDLKQIVEPWLSKGKWTGGVDEFLQFWFKAENHVDERVVEMIERLRESGIKCFLATNQEEYRVKYMKEQMGIAELFDGVFSSADIGAKKPERGFYEFILADLKSNYEILPKEVMYFDDSKSNVEESSKLGIDGYFYESFSGFESVVNPLLH